MSSRWFYSDGSDTHGPVSRDDLEALLAGGRLTRDHFVVPEGSEDWQTIGESEFALLIEKKPAAISLPPVPGSHSTKGRQNNLPSAQTGLPPVPGGPKAKAPSSHSRSSSRRANSQSSPGATKTKDSKNRTGTVIGIVAAVLIGFCGLSGMVGNCSGGGASSEARAINRVLGESQKIAANAANRFQNDPGNYALFVSQQYQRVDLRGCPNDFRYAYQQHINAWHQAAPYFAVNIPLNSFLEGLYSGYTGDFSNFGQTSSNAQLAAQGIQQTYYQLTQLAAGYGANIP